MWTNTQVWIFIVYLSVVLSRKSGFPWRKSATSGHKFKHYSNAFVYFVSSHRMLKSLLKSQDLHKIDKFYFIKENLKWNWLFKKTFECVAVKKHYQDIGATALIHAKWTNSFTCCFCTKRLMICSIFKLSPKLTVFIPAYHSHWAPVSHNPSASISP